LVDALKGTSILEIYQKRIHQIRKPLSGILKADVTTKFDMQSVVENSQYETSSIMLEP
jgi:hypothetical protein